MLLVRTTPPELRTVDINDLALNTTLYYASDLSYAALDIGLSSALFGVLTSLVIVAVIFLARKGLDHTPVRVLLPSTLVLYGSTALYMASLASHVVSINHLVSQARAGLYSTAFTDADVQVYRDDVLRQSWMMTFALGINLLVGDSIVWWRACAIWPRNKIVYCLGPLLITLTFAFGAKAMSEVHECASPCKQPEMLFPDGFFTNTCAALSLAVNMLATALIGYKTWAHRQLLRGHFGHGYGRGKSRVMKALTLLVESGTIYCILLILLIVYEASPANFASPDVHQSALLRAVADYTYACFIPVMAIYPVLIIVIVALDCSPIDHGLTDVTQLGNEDVASQPRRLGSDRVTMSTFVVMDTTRCHRSPCDSEGGASGDTEVKYANGV